MTVCLEKDETVVSLNTNKVTTLKRTSVGNSVLFIMVIEHERSAH